MRRIFLIASREFIATVSTKAFIIGLFIMPAIIAVGAVVAPRLLNPRTYRVQGDLAIVDPTGRVVPELRAGLSPEAIVRRRAEDARQALERAPASARKLAESAGIGSRRAFEAALGPVPDLQVVELPANVDVDRQKDWLQGTSEGRPHLGLAVIDENAVVPAAGESDYGAYKLYVPPKLDDRAATEIQRSLRDALIDARIRARAMDREAIDSIVRVPRVQSVTVTKEEERDTVREMNFLLPAAFGALLFIGVMTGGQALLTSAVEEKSSRVIEVLLSAVSPMELMAGKLLGQMAVSLVALGLYVLMGIAMLTSFSLFGLLNPWLIFYLVIFFAITYLVIGSLMMAVGSAVNEMREAQSLMTPIMLMLMIPWLLWMPIVRDSNSAFSIAMSFIPPVNSFAMLLRMASVTPPPWWQVWLSIAVGIASVFAAIWFTAKVFRIGLLMYGKPPNFATLIRWVRAA
jgi:ABC-2 type transport system permease protein